MEYLEPILAYIVVMLGAGWFVGKACGLTGKAEKRIYEEQSRGTKGENRRARQDVGL